MGFRPGLLSVNNLVVDQAVASSIVPVNAGSTGTGNTPFSFNLGANVQIMWKVKGVFTLGATGGFRFLAHCTQAPSIYNAEYLVSQATTPANLPNAQFAEAAFANASAVADTYRLDASGFVKNGATASVFSFQFAQNTSDVLAITLKAGFRIEILLV